MVLIIPDQFGDAGIAIRRTADQGILDFSLQTDALPPQVRTVQFPEQTAGKMVEVPGNEELVVMDQAGDEFPVAGPDVAVHGTTDEIPQFPAVQITVDGDHLSPPGGRDDCLTP